MVSVALTVVVRDGAGIRHERCVLLSGESMLIGRGWHCDLIVQDPQVDAEHARLSVTEDGELMCSDMGSLNGLRIVGAAKGAEEHTFESGGVLELGRSSLSVFRSDHAVVPAVEPSRWDAIRVLLERPAWAIGSLLLLLVCSTIELLGASARELTADSFIGGISPAVLGTGVWVLFWGVLSKLLRNSAHLTAHFSIALSSSIAVFLLSQIARYLGWQTLSVDVASFVTVAGTAALMFVVVTLTLGVATRLRRRRLVLLACLPGVLLLASVYLLPLLREHAAQWYPEIVTTSYPPGWQISSGVTLSDFLADTSSLYEASADQAVERAKELAAETTEGSER